MKYTLIMTVIMLTSVGVLVGCATRQPNLLRNGQLHLKHAETGKIRAIWFSAFKQSNGLDVQGYLKRYDRTGAAIKAHADITILTADGTVLASARSLDLYVPRNRIGGGPQRYKRFSVFFEFTPPTGSVIQVTVHTSSHNKSTQEQSTEGISVDVGLGLATTLGLELPAGVDAFASDSLDRVPGLYGSWRQGRWDSDLRLAYPWNGFSSLGLTREVETTKSNKVDLICFQCMPKDLDSQQCQDMERIKEPRRIS